MMKATRLYFPDCDMEQANHLLSGFLCSGFGIGQALGPLLGSFLFSLTDFKMTQNITAIMTMVYGVLYLLCAGGSEAFY